MRKALFAVFALTATAAWADGTYKCGAVYQDHPCAGAVVAAKPASAVPSGMTSPDEVIRMLQARDATPALAAAPLAPVCGGHWLPLEPGLTKEQVLACTAYQHPDAINTTGNVEQYVFNRGAHATYLYFSGEKLQTVQN